jgi:hypothetical protein
MDHIHYIFILYYFDLENPSIWKTNWYPDGSRMHFHNKQISCGISQTPLPTEGSANINTINTYLRTSAHVQVRVSVLNCIIHMSICNSYTSKTFLFPLMSSIFCKTRYITYWLLKYSYVSNGTAIRRGWPHWLCFILIWEIYIDQGKIREFYFHIWLGTLKADI